MVWAALAILGVPIWLIVGALGGGLYTRHEFRSHADVFAIRVRKVDPGIPGKWGKKMYARWAHDVLLANKGLALVRTEGYPVTSFGPAAKRPRPDEAKGLGDHPVAVTVTLDDGAVVEIAAAQEDATLLTLPFDLDLGTSTS